MLATASDTESGAYLRSLWRNDLVATEAEQAGLPLLRLDGSETTESIVDRALDDL